MMRRGARRADDGELEIEVLLERMGPRLRALSRRLGLTVEDHEDLLQDACVRLLLAGEAIRNREAWLAVVFRNELFRLGRDRSRRRELLEREAVSETLAPKDAEKQLALHLTLVRALSSLSERARSAVILHHLLGLRLDETARRLGYRESSMKRVLNRALARMRKFTHAVPMDKDSEER
jgi:RNA polymerase sigma factor (sigma-70 family)